MPVPIKVRTFGFDVVEEILRRAPRRSAKKVARRLVEVGCRIVKKEVKNEIPIDEGLTKKYQDYKVRVYGMSARGWVGTDITRLKADGEKRPNNIDYLINFGHVKGPTDTFVLQGLLPVGYVVPPNPYLARAASQSQSQVQTATEHAAAAAVFAVMAGRT